MAEKVQGVMSVELTVEERAYVVTSLARMRAQVQRQAAKEVPGSEVWHARGREDEKLEALAKKFQRSV